MPPDTTGAGGWCSSPMKIDFGSMDPEVQAVYDEELRKARIGAAWERWEQASCEEFNGGHAWELVIEQGSASLACRHRCGAEPFPDCADFITGTFDVDVDVIQERHRNYEYPDDWDIWVEVTPRA
jgi:hypothetical protein